MTSPPSYAHLTALTDRHGVFARALLTAARRDHGYSVGDAAGALIVVTREPDRTPQLDELAETYLRVLERALGDDGRSHARMSEAGRFADTPGLGDAWGHAVHALGVVQSHGISYDHRERAARHFAHALPHRPRELRPLVFAGLGAAAVLESDAGNGGARDLLAEAATAVSRPGTVGWPWPEPRLRYANGTLPDLLLSAGARLGRDDHLEHGLRMLRFLLDRESAGGHLSVSGVDGRGPDEINPLFDQQPVEVSALAAACFRAFAVTSDPTWLVGVESAWGWFVGRNDIGVAMFDDADGAGYDELERRGRSENRGAASTIAALTTYQLARRAGVLD